MAAFSDYSVEFVTCRTPSGIQESTSLAQYDQHLHRDRFVACKLHWLAASHDRPSSVGPVGSIAPSSSASTTSADASLCCPAQCAAAHHRKTETHQYFVVTLRPATPSATRIPPPSAPGSEAQCSGRIPCPPPSHVACLWVCRQQRAHHFHQRLVLQCDVQ